MTEMPRAGDRVEDFTLDCTDGRFTLSERVKGGPVLLYFYVVNFGKTCTNYMAEMNERFDDFKKRNITLYHVNDASLEDHRGWMNHTASKYQILSDPDKAVCRQFDCIVRKAKSDKIIGYPNRGFFLIDKDLKVLFSWQADMPMETVPMDELFAEIDKAL